MLYLSGTWNKTQWAVWKIEEDENQLFKHLNNGSWYTQILTHKSSQRRLK